MKNEDFLTTEYISKIFQGLPSIQIFTETFGEYHEVLKCFPFKTKKIAKIRLYKLAKGSDFEIYNMMWINADDIDHFKNLQGFELVEVKTVFVIDNDLIEKNILITNTNDK